MTTTAKSIIRRAVDVLQDKTSVRWTVQELVRWLNSGQNDLLIYRPDALGFSEQLNLQPGPRQDLESLATSMVPISLSKIVRNTAATSLKRPVRLVSLATLEATAPDWYSMDGVVDITNYTYDPQDATIFFVYPPATAETQLEIRYVAKQIDVAEPAAVNATFADVTGNISVTDQYANALLDYVLYRAFLKDAEFAANAARAQAHQQAYASALGIEIKAGALTQIRPDKTTPPITP